MMSGSEEERNPIRFSDPPTLGSMKKVFANKKPCFELTEASSPSKTSPQKNSEISDLVCKIKQAREKRVVQFEEDMVAESPRTEPRCYPQQLKKSKSISSKGKILLNNLPRQKQVMQSNPQICVDDKASNIVPRIRGRSSPKKDVSPYNLTNIDQMLETNKQVIKINR